MELKNKFLNQDKRSQKNENAWAKTAQQNGILSTLDPASTWDTNSMHFWIPRESLRTSSQSLAMLRILNELSPSLQTGEKRPATSTRQTPERRLGIPTLLMIMLPALRPLLETPMLLRLLRRRFGEVAARIKMRHHFPSSYQTSRSQAWRS